MRIMHIHRQEFSSFFKQGKNFTYEPIIRLNKLLYNNLLQDIIHNTIPNNTNPLYKLSYIIQTTYNNYTGENVWENLLTPIPNTKILYAICTTTRVYIGITNNAQRRIKEHLYYIKKRMIITETLGKQKAFAYKNNTINKKLYHILSKKDTVFSFIPLCRMNNAECEKTEQKLIKMLGSNVMNEQRSQAKHMRATKEIHSSTPIKTCKKRKHFSQPTNTTHINKQIHNKAEKNYKIQPTLFIHNNITYMNIQKLMNDNNDTQCKFIVLTGTANGYRALNSAYIKLCTLTHGDSKCEVTVNNTQSCILLKNIHTLILNNLHSRIQITTTPTRIYTASELLYIKMENKLKTKDSIENIVNGMNTIVAEKQPARFWIKLFKHTNFIENKNVIKMIRRFIAQYIWISFQIPKEQIINGISLNIILDYHPCLNIDAIAQCQKTIAGSFPLNDANDLYCTFKKSEPIESILMNHKQFTNNYKIYDIPACHCTGVCNGKHEIVLPENSSKEDNKVLRNIKTPVANNAKTTFAQIVQQLYNIAYKTRLYTSNFNIYFFNLLELHPNNNNTITCKSKHVDIIETVNINTLTKLLTPLYTNSNTHSIIIRMITTTMIENNLTFISAINKLRTHIHHNNIISDKDTYSLILYYNLLTNNYTINETDHIIAVLSHTYDSNKETTDYSINLTQLTLQLKEKHKHQVWIPVDKNNRKAARMCPIAAHNFITKLFICDTAHFEVLNYNSNDYDKTQNTTINTIKNNLTNIKLYYNKSKPFTLPNLYFSIKLDGKRARPIGAYAKLNYKNILSHAATAMLNILKFSGITHFSLLYQQNIKHYIKQINDTAQQGNYFINKDTYDVKNFYTEIQKEELWKRLNFIFDMFVKNNHTNIISIPKFKLQKDCTPKPGSTKDPKFMNFSVAILKNIIHFALNNAFFKIGYHVLKQINGLPIGDPISGPLAFVMLHMMNTNGKYHIS